MATGSHTRSAHQISAEKKEQFAQKMVTTVNSAGLSMMISIGHRTELFDRMAEMDWGTSEHGTFQRHFKRSGIGNWADRFHFEFGARQEYGGFVVNGHERACSFVRSARAVSQSAAICARKAAMSSNFFSGRIHLISRVRRCRP